MSHVSGSSGIALAKAGSELAKTVVRRAIINKHSVASHCADVTNNRFFYLHALSNPLIHHSTHVIPLNLHKKFSFIILLYPSSVLIPHISPQKVLIHHSVPSVTTRLNHPSFCFVNLTKCCTRNLLTRAPTSCTKIQLKPKYF